MVVFQSLLVRLLAYSSTIIFLSVHATEVTPYYVPGTGPQATLTTDPSQFTGLMAYNPKTIDAPPLPSGTDVPAASFQINLGPNPSGLSIPIPAGFFGFSVEMSVANQVLGKNSTLIQVPFLNLMSNMILRAGHVKIRVGGNSQEDAQLVDSLPDGRILAKDTPNGDHGNTATPHLTYTTDLLYMMRNISSLLDVRWFVGSPFFKTDPFDMSIMIAAEEILQEHLIGVQVGNEPDQYALHFHRGSNGDVSTYNPTDYFNDFQSFVNQMNANSSMPDAVKSLLVGPSISQFYVPDDVWKTGYADTFGPNLAFLSVERYPDNNCAAVFGPGPNNPIIDPQSVIAQYANHYPFVVNLVRDNFLSSTDLAQQKQKPFIMFETNTAACGGFLGVSDSFTASLWGFDYALQMASSNFSAALFHIGGQNVTYNPFTAPPTNQSSFRQWSVGALYYSALAAAEAIGPSNTSRVIDLFANSGSAFTPVYAIYEPAADGTQQPARIALINYMDDPSGASDYTANIQVPQNPSTVWIKTLSAPSLTSKGNTTWANQTFGDLFTSDGRPVGTMQVVPVTCSGGVCPIKVKAPSAVLVFLNGDPTGSIPDGTQDPAVGGGHINGGLAMTFATTAKTKTHNTATVDRAVLSTSNGHSGKDLEQKGSTSRGKSDAGVSLRSSVWVSVGAMMGAMIGGGLIFIR